MHVFHGVLALNIETLVTCTFRGLNRDPYHSDPKLVANRALRNERAFPNFPNVISVQVGNDLKVLSHGDTRFDLDGSPVGEVTAEQRQQASDTLRERFKKKAQRPGKVLESDRSTRPRVKIEVRERSSPDEARPHPMGKILTSAKLTLLSGGSVKGLTDDITPTVQSAPRVKNLPDVPQLASSPDPSVCRGESVHTVRRRYRYQRILNTENNHRSEWNRPARWHRMSILPCRFGRAARTLHGVKSNPNGEASLLALGRQLMGK